MKHIRPMIILILGIAGSALFTWLCIISGVDWQIAKYFERNSILVYAAIPGVIAGMIVPFVIMAYYYIKGRKDGKEYYLPCSKNLGLGFLCSFGLSTFLKSISNRMDMEPFETLGNHDFSNGFRWGFLNSNNLWESFSEGWPSGHSMVATTFLFILLPVLGKAQKVFHSLYVLVIMMSVVTAFHWFSDVMSGAILGIIIGKHFQIKISK